MKDLIPSKNIEVNIFNRIAREKIRIARLRLLFAGTILATSIVSMIPTLSYLSKNLRMSGFYDFLSLILSDHTSLVLYWKEFSLTLTESLPFISLALFLIICGVLIWSLSIATRNARLAFRI